MTKNICKSCKKQWSSYDGSNVFYEWDDYDDEYWLKGYFPCETFIDFTKGIYPLKQLKLPNCCDYKLEHIILDQNE